MGGRTAAVLVIGLVLFTACDAPTRPECRGQITALSVDGTVAADGSLSLKQDVTFVGDHGGYVPVRAPVLATAKDVTLDGAPRTDTASSSTVQIRALRRAVSVAATVDGISERYADIVIITVPVWGTPQDGAADDPLVPINGKIHLPAPPVAGTVHWHGAITAHVEDASADLRGASLREAQADGLDLTQATLSRADLRGANFTAASMIQATLSKVDARGAVLDEVSFIPAHLEDADFTDASMKGAKFIQAAAQGAVFVRADVSGARGVGDLGGADLTGAKGRPGAQALRWLLLLGGAGVVLVIALIIVWRSRGIARDDTLLDLTGTSWPAAGFRHTGLPPPGPRPGPGLPGDVGPTAGGPQTGPPPPGPG